MIIDFEQLAEVRKQHRDESIVLRAGCFDLIHEGHIQGLEVAKTQGDILVVGVHPDYRVTERKGPARPIRPQAARLAVVDALGAVDYSLIMPSNDEVLGHATLRVVAALRPDVFVAPMPSAGSSEHPNDARIREMGTRLYFDPYRPPHSTTRIIDTILQKYGALEGSSR